MPPVALIDPAAIDTSHVLVDREGIGRHNPQRFEMVQLTAIIFVDVENKLVVGYKDVGPMSSGCAATCRTTRSCPAC